MKVSFFAFLGFFLLSVLSFNAYSKIADMHLGVFKADSGTYVNTTNDPQNSTELKCTLNSTQLPNAGGDQVLRCERADGVAAVFKRTCGDKTTYCNIQFYYSTQDQTQKISVKGPACVRDEKPGENTLNVYISAPPCK